MIYVLIALFIGIIILSSIDLTRAIKVRKRGSIIANAIFIIFYLYLTVANLIQIIVRQP